MHVPVDMCVGCSCFAIVRFECKGRDATGMCNCSVHGAEAWYNDDVRGVITDVILTVVYGV